MLPDAKPVPLYAEVVTPGSSYSVTFDRLLQNGPLAAANWAVRHAGQLYDATNALALDEAVYLTVTPTLPTVLPDGVDYAATPADVKALDGTPADPFEGLPFA